MKVPFYKPAIGEDEINEVVETLRSGWITTGPRTKQFEKEFSEYLGVRHSVALNSCTAALHLALEAIGLKAGQGVVVPTMTFAATAEVVRYFGARPILVDCRESDLNMDITDARRRITSAISDGFTVAAIIPVHYGGQIGDMDGVHCLAREFGLKVIEDAAHCCPAYWRSGDRVAADGSPADSPRAHQPSTINPQPPGWLPVGHGSDISCYSFYANKTITTGEGGMACTNNDEYADRMRIMSLHGISRDAWKRFTAEGSWYYEIIAPGYKYNLTDIASAIGIHQLRKAGALHRRRAELASLYSEFLADVEELVLPRQMPDRIHSWHLYAVRLRLDRPSLDRAQFIDALKQCGIGTSVHWLPLHMHPYYREAYGYQPADFPTAAGIYPELVTLPLYPGMTEDDVGFVCDSIKQTVSVHAAKHVVR